MTDETHCDVAIVGGGVIGCAVARALAPAFDVTLFERDVIASGATARAAGEVTTIPSYTDYPGIGEYAMDFFREYDGHERVEFSERHSLELVVPASEDAARRRTDRLSSEGFDVSFLEPADVERRYPRFDLESYAGAVRHGDTGFIDPYTLTMALATDAEENGANLRTGTQVDELVVEDGQVAGVDTASGIVRADHVVVAAGWRTPAFLRDHVELPIRPYRTQILVLEPDEPMGESFPMGWIPGKHVYFRPELNGDLLVGGWSFAEDDPAGASRDADGEFVEHVADLVPAFLRSLDEAGLSGDWAGIDAATPDTRPIVDAPTDGPDGLVVATGFHGRGVMTAPVAAALVRALVVDEDVPFPTAPFELDRFDDRSGDFEFVSISDGADNH
ncbi:NAD(P)/FAD-dependent oxidoreductase [Halosolutus halophilus]|uniref:NAD(P)/FAD-dependent oxidoreductase n=1 Tax=Halosolutus halophilus TaxID=1552990 RepID=UPI0022351A5A|nr:FAD-dependent oxidoreductase [Halosolutus halophilus]